MKKSVLLAGAAILGLSLLGSGTVAQEVDSLGTPTRPEAAAHGPAGVLAPIEKSEATTFSFGRRASHIIGASVVNNADMPIGRIDDLIVTADGKADRAILSVGGFLGVGSRLVAVPFDELKFGESDAILSNATTESLSVMPEFHYGK